MVASLTNKFEVVPYSFSNQLEQGIDSVYDRKLTDISHALNQVYDQYANRNIGAIILSSDGIFNSGQNPIYTVDRKSNVPLFTIGLGDTMVVKDLYISGVDHNDVAFLSNDFPVRITITNNGFDGEEVNVNIASGGKTIQSKKIAFKAGQLDADVDFLLTAGKVGYQKYTVSVSRLGGEFTFKNNTKNFYVNVIDGRQKILLTYGFTHPDIAAINYVIENNKNYDLTVAPITELKTELTRYDLIIVHNYQKTNSLLNDIINTNEVPVLHIVGVNADFSNLVKYNIGVNGSGNKDEDIVCQFNPSFKDILFNEKTVSLLNAAPPLNSPQGNLTFSDGAQIVAFQKIGNIKLSKPLIYTNQKDNNKYAVILGEGIWRWRLYDQLQNETTENFAAFFSQMITYLAVKENKDPFKINIENEYEESEKIVVKAELYNASYQLTNDEEVALKLSDEEGKEYNYTFYRTEEAYLLELGRLKQGIYNWTASTTFENKRLVKNGSFIVKETKRELLNLTANHRLLFNLSKSTNGKFYLPSETDQLKTDLEAREDIVTVAYQEKSFKDAIDYKWLFFLLLLMLTSEWFFRKYHGGY